MQQAIREDAAAPTLIDLQVQQRLQHASVAALCPSADRAGLQAIAALLQPMLQERDDPMLHARGLQWLALVHLAQRQGQFELARRWLDEQRPCCAACAVRSRTAGCASSAPWTNCRCSGPMQPAR